MRKLTFGTSYFISLTDAISYYVQMGFTSRDVREKIINHEISIGEPKAWIGYELVVDSDGRFHQVGIDDEIPLREANKAMNKTNRITDWIYAGREVALIVGGVVLFGTICYLVFLGV